MKDNFEEQRRKKFFQELNEKKKIIQVEIKKNRKTERKLQIKGKPNNIARVTFKKISNDIVPQFRKAGLNFYAKSTVTTAIQRQLVSYVDNGHRLLQEYNTNLNIGKNNISQKENREEAVKTAQDKLRQYEEIEARIEDYNLSENIIDAIVNLLCPDRGLKQLGCCVPNMINRDIAPTLNKLGLEDLVPQLKQRIIEKYRKVDQESMILPEVDIPYYVEKANDNSLEKNDENSTDEDVLELGE